MAKKPTLIIDMLAAPPRDEDREESPSSPLSEREEPASGARDEPARADDPERTIASIRAQLDQLEAALRGLV